MDRELLAAMTEYVQVSQRVIARLIEEKGDVTGHEFHGNRYTGGIGERVARGLANFKAADGSIEKINLRDARALVKQLPDTSKVKNTLSGAFDKVAIARDADGRPVGAVTYTKLNRAIDIHELWTEPDAPKGTGVSLVSHVASEIVRGGTMSVMSSVNDEFWKAMGGNQPANMSTLFWDRNAVDELRGKSIDVIEEKGDVAGHGFHGNRYTGGLGGSDEGAHGVAVAKVPPGELTGDAMDQLERVMGMARVFEDEADHPENYEPNTGYGVRLKPGATSMRVGKDEQGNPIAYDVRIDGTSWHGLETVPGSERPLPYVFRVMSQAEFDGAAKNGYFQSDQRMNLANEGTVTSSRGTGTFYMTPGDNRIVRIRIESGDNWKVDSDEYIKTKDRIPFERADLVSPTITWTRTKYGGEGVIKGFGSFDTKGDVAGHGFHGNRWTGGIGGSGNLPFNVHGDQYFHALSPKGQEYVKAQSAKFGVTPEGIAKEIEGRLRNPDGSVKTDVIAEGAKWYPMAHEVTVKVSESTQGQPHPVTPEVVATVLAELSPQTPWATNVEVGARLSQWYASGKGDGLTPEQATLAFKAEWQAQGWGGKTKGSGYTENAKLAMMNGQVTEALQVLTGEKTIEESLSSPKQRSFANNIMLPGQTRDVTVDVMMQKAITFASGPPPLPKDPAAAEESGQDRGKTVANFFQGKSVAAAAGAGYVTTAAGTRMAADRLGVSPDVVQASYWIQVQDVTPPGWPRSTGATMPDMATPLVTQLLGHPFIGTGNTGKAALDDHDTRGLNGVQPDSIFPLSVDYGIMALTEAETMTDDEVEAELALEDSEDEAEQKEATGHEFHGNQYTLTGTDPITGAKTYAVHHDGEHMGHVRQAWHLSGGIGGSHWEAVRLGKTEPSHIGKTRALVGELLTRGILKERALGQKGDISGHAFHGNRYTGGIGGGDKPIHVSSIEEAIALLGEGKGIMFERPDQAVTLLHELARMAKEAKAAGREAKTYDLCKVSVTGTNLFCAQNVGIPRSAMPQLSGKPLPGTPADSLPKNAKGEVDITQAFRDSLIAQGHMILDTQEFASHLRASQTEMNGVKVAGMMESLEAGRLPPGSIFVSDDNYVIDGHHRWAANVGVGLGERKEMSMPIARINMKILPALAAANQFAAAMGIPQAGVEKGAWYLNTTGEPESTAKGDVAGHGFHGNRYTGGIGGSDPAVGEKVSHEDGKDWHFAGWHLTDTEDLQSVLKFNQKVGRRVNGGYLFTTDRAGAQKWNETWTGDRKYAVEILTSNPMRMAETSKSQPLGFNEWQVESQYVKVGRVIPAADLKGAPVTETKSARRGDRKGHPFRGNRYTGGIKRDNGTGAV